MSCSASRTVEIFVHRRARRLHLAVELRELLQRLEDELQHPDRGDQRADLERAGVDQLRAGEEHDARSRSTPRNSIAGKNTDESFWAYTFETRFASLSSSNSRWKARSRLNAWTTAMPDDGLGELRGDGRDARPHVANATCDARWNQRVTKTPAAARRARRAPSRQSSRKRPPIAARRVRS